MGFISIVDTTLQEAQQCLWDGQMQIEELGPVLEKIDQAGYHSAEVWGGGTFAASLHYLQQDPWQTLRFLRARIKNTPLQAVIGGHCLVGSTPFPPAVIEKFIGKGYDNGISIFRLYDPLNDWLNLKLPIQSVKKTGGHAQAALICTQSPLWTGDYYLRLAEQLVAAGADSLCIIDTAGVLTPDTTFALVKEIKNAVSVPVAFHTHYNAGMAIVNCLKAAEAGIDLLHAASAPLSFGPSLPPVETLVHCLHDGGFSTGLKKSDLFAIADYLEEVRQKEGFNRGNTTVADLYALDHHVPGTLVRQVEGQLKTIQAEDKLREVLTELGKVGPELGYPSLLEPVGPILAHQAILNVTQANRYATVSEEVKRYLQGLYGQPSGPVDQKVATFLADYRPDGEVNTLVDPPAFDWDTLEEEIEDLVTKEEDVLTYALFPEPTRKLLTALAATESTSGPDFQPDNQKSTDFVSEEETEMKMSDIRELLSLLNGSGVTELSIENGDFKVYLKRSLDEIAGKSAESPPPFAAPETKEKDVPAATLKPVAEAPKPVVKKSNLIPVTAPIVGRFYRSQEPGKPPFVEVGTKVHAGDILCIIEAMKVMNEVASEAEGTVVEILVENGKPVEYGQTLILLEREVSA